MIQTHICVQRYQTQYLYGNIYIYIFNTAANTRMSKIIYWNIPFLKCS